MTNNNNNTQLPAHLVELAKKMEQSGFTVSAEDAKKIRARQEVTIIDRTPKGYGPIA